MEDAAAFFVNTRLRVGKIELGRRPSRAGVTGFAVRAKRPGVKRRVAVTTSAAGGKPLERPQTMTLLTCRAGVTAREREVRAVVVETCVFPIRRVVAGFALGSKPPAVFVVFAVAGITIGGRTLVNVVHMAFFTGGFGVFPLQFKGRKIMVKVGRLPCLRRVTGGAIRPVCACVGVVSLVAGKTILRGGLQIRNGARIQVAARAGRYGMSPG